MQHTIPVETLGLQGPAMVEAIEKCVHCGICLATCPTYMVLGNESDSPRGRIFLMKENLEGNVALDAVLPFVDRCVRAEQQRRRPPLKSVTRVLVKETLPYPDRFRNAVTAGKLGKLVARAMPAEFRAMLNLLPGELPRFAPLPDLYPAVGPRRARVALLAGCVQQVLAPQIAWATLRVLAQNGVETVIPRGQGCCGALSMHIGEAEQARELARQNLAVFDLDVDAIITNAAGCGSGMQEYQFLFAGLPEAEAAAAFGRKAQDITVFLDQLGVKPPPPLPEPIRIAYHDACHLAHAQGVTAPPRRLLNAIPNVTVVEIPEGELCCGSAGTYNMEQPELAAQIGERKARHIIATGAHAVATGNIGCMTQIRTQLAALGKPIPIWHTVEVLDAAYAGG
ncbi:MAG: 2-hydroxy-acid oxidase [Anaerolineales bacterium]|nr:2-hydroxy-acid oxidase [Anaerolineales bacterium]